MAMTPTNPSLAIVILRDTLPRVARRRRIELSLWAFIIFTVLSEVPAVADTLTIEALPMIRALNHGCHWVQAVPMDTLACVKKLVIVIAHAVVNILIG